MGTLIFISTHSIFKDISDTMITEKQKEETGVNQKYYVALTTEEWRMVIDSLSSMRNRLISEGRYTDAVDEVLLKIIGAKQKNFKVIFKEA